MSQEAFNELTYQIGKVIDLRSSTALLSWDQQTQMPAEGASARGEQLATLAGVSQEILSADRIGELLDQSKSFAADKGEESFEAAFWNHVKRTYDKAKRIPIELSEERERASNIGYQAWRKSRAASDYSQFEPALARNIELVREIIRIQKPAMGMDDEYDVMLDDYEPGLKASDIDLVFERLKGATKPLLEQVVTHADNRESLVHGSFSKSTQQELMHAIVTHLGFTDSAWRLDETAHPFAKSLARNDIRITTRYEEGFLNASFFSTLHEFGHGLYEHQIPESLERTPLARGASTMWHESQSRMWENLVGRGRPFWTWALPKVQEAFPDQFSTASADAMYRAVNAMGPSLIRIEADELTYNLHVILRYELERSLISGDISTKDLPEAWNAKVKEYIGIDVPNDAQGVLQDVHWGWGRIGYFPTYTLGNVLGAMLWDRINDELPNLEDEIARGNFHQLRTWLGEHIHQYGSSYMPIDLLEKVLGVRHLDAEPLISYLTTKVNDLYG